ncbi:hypothetical protein CJ030_MR3G012308 [Morella rubra]|uniref:Uncharacterized protein n=1 Tax=Morella rubra TaxID=262757 RepID=A0A6A1W2Q5_9ROSI|nr:hypothetical protein CJ030_MR3G012308 [Morella rubra]
MTQLTEWMQSVLRPTHEMVSDISCRLTTLEQKVMDMDSGWKKEIAAVQEAMRKVATGVELFALTQRVVYIEEHLSQIHDVLKISDDNDDDLRGNNCKCTMQRRSAINKENRAKLKIVDTYGTRSFQRAKALLHESEGKSYTEVEIFAEVLGTKAGYVRGLGRSVRSVGSSSSAASVDLSWRLEEARLEIEEMRLDRWNMKRF